MSTTSNKRQPRGAVQKAGSTFIAAWIPDEIVAAIDRAVLSEDTDRSKVIRKALRNYLNKITLP